MLYGGCLLLVASIKAQAAQHAAKAITAEHAAVRALTAALQSGEAFKMGFVYFAPKLPAEAKARQARAVARAMRRLRATLPEKPSYEYMFGCEFTLAAMDERTVAIRRAVGLEMAGATPSRFRLSSKPRQQVYTVFRVKGHGDRTWRLHALMYPVEGGWKSGGLTAFLERIGTMDAEAALAAGQKEAAAGHGAVALALYGLANELGKMPRYRTSVFQQRLRAAHEPLAKKLGLPHQAVATVETPTGKFAISYTNARVFRRGAYLLLFREAPRKERPKDPAAHQRQLAAAFLKRHPELKPYFVGIAVNERYTGAAGIESDDRALFLNAELEGT